MTFVFFLPYCAGTMLGSVFGVRISMWIESKLGAAADGHLKSNNAISTVEECVTLSKDLAAYWDYRDRPGIVPLRFKEWLSASKSESQLEETIKPMSDELKYARYKDSRKGLPRLGFEAWKRTGKSN